MNTSLTEIAFVLDRSGSMESCAESAIAGFNQFLRDQRALSGDARLSLILFDDQYEVPYQSIPLSEAAELDTTTFVPRGSTALLDAIGRTIDELGARLAAMPEDDRPAGVIVAILTDGLENASHRYSLRDVSERIARQRDVYKWHFLFLGANQDAIATAASMSIDHNMSAMYCASVDGFQNTMKSISRKTSALRMAMKSPPGKCHEIKDLTKPLSDILREEEGKRRAKGKKK